MAQENQFSSNQPDTYYTTTFLPGLREQLWKLGKSKAQ
jgi:hypothetical protein